MTAVLGLFMLVAGFGSVIPTFVHDRIPMQFVPVWEWMLIPFGDASTNPGTVLTFAYASQWLIAIIEWTAGLLLITATIFRRKRLVLTNLGVGLCIGLFGAFMITMFAMHHYELPRWNQYPSILAWLGVTWAVVALAEPHTTATT